MANVDVSGHWAAHQSNGFAVHFNLDEDVPSGTVHGDAFVKGTHGACSGSVRGDEFLVTVNWDNGPRGRYSGRRGLDDRLAGDTVDMANPTSRATWFSDPLPML